MIFSDPSGDDGIHPVSPLQLPSINPPPTRSDIVHRSLNCVIPYRKNQNRVHESRDIIPPMNIDHLYYKVKDLLDDGTGSSVEKNDSIGKEEIGSVQTHMMNRKMSKTKASKYLDDGSSSLKQEIVFSEERVRSVRAGKNLHFLFPGPGKKFIEPNKNFYNRQRLGTPIYEINSKTNFKK